MSQGNVEAFKRSVEALSRRDFDAALVHYDPEVGWYPGPQAVLAGGKAVYRGHDGIRKLIDDFDGVFDQFEFEFTDYRDLGDRLLAIGELRVRGRASGVETVSLVAYIVDAKDGRAIRVRTYLDPTEALAAAGLSE
jgi:ketosteroid isomerase-like protein